MILPRILVAAVLLGLVLITPAASADYQSSCINHRGTTGISVALQDCIPPAGPLVEKIEQALCGPTDCEA